MAPNCSITIASGPADAVLKSKPSLCRASETCLRLSVVGEKAHWTIAVREEINGVADPHGVVIVGIVAGHLDDAGILQSAIQMGVVWPPR